VPHDSGYTPVLGVRLFMAVSTCGVQSVIPNLKYPASVVSDHVFLDVLKVTYGILY